MPALSSLPSGQSESGDYDIRTANAGAGSAIGQTVTFPISLAAGIPRSNVIFTAIDTPVTGNAPRLAKNIAR